MQGFCIVLNFTLDTSYHNWINESTLWVQVFALTFYLTFSKNVAFFPMTWNPPSKSVPIIEWLLPDNNSFMLVSYENFCFVSLCLMSNYSISGSSRYRPPTSYFFLGIQVRWIFLSWPLTASDFVLLYIIQALFVLSFSANIPLK